MVDARRSTKAAPIDGWDYYLASSLFTQVLIVTWPQWPETRGRTWPLGELWAVMLQAAPGQEGGREEVMTLVWRSQPGLFEHHFLLALKGGQGLVVAITIVQPGPAHVG